ncbi:MAG: hypothetical protein ACREIV_04565, partial [Planctomycetaceae bacterium]
LLEGFRLDANGGETPVELSGNLSSTRLSRTEITGFTDSGVVCEGVFGFGVSEESAARLERLVFRPEDADAVGVRLAPSDAGTSTMRVQILDCRFLGPMNAGLVVEDDVSDLTVRGTIFSETQAGVRVSGPARYLSNWTIQNNTFYRNGTPIEFERMPTTSSSRLAFQRNLFAETREAEAVVAEGFREGAIRPMLGAVSENWTDRPAPQDAAGEVNLFRGGQRGRTIAFASTDPRSSEFLAPAADAAHAKAKEGQEPLRPYIGAVGP